MANQNTIYKINFYTSYYSTLEETTLGKKIKKYRLMKGLTQNELSNLCGILRTTINDYEQDYIKPGISNLEKLKKSLKL